MRLVVPSWMRTPCRTTCVVPPSGCVCRKRRSLLIWMALCALSAPRLKGPISWSQVLPVGTSRNLHRGCLRSAAGGMPRMRAAASSSRVICMLLLRATCPASTSRRHRCSLTRVVPWSSLDSISRAALRGGCLLMASFLAPRLGPLVSPCCPSLSAGGDTLTRHDVPGTSNSLSSMAIMMRVMSSDLARTRQSANTSRYALTWEPIISSPG
mmetsp:Transcript_19977/g.43524  ORF Transcript_19977/g.43524 Transcript_19977/m.43524 type:complete len:211 (+) Transcript_19977:4668-5300(+)